MGSKKKLSVGLSGDNVLLTTLQTTIITSIAQNNNQISSICKAMARNPKKHRSNVHRALKTLILKDLVTYEEKTRLYYLTEKGIRICLEKSIHNQVTTFSPKDSRSDNKRAHNIQIKFPVIRAPRGWRESPKEFFKYQVPDYTPLGLKNQDGVQFTMADIIVKATPHNVTITLQQFYYEDALEYFPHIQRIAFRLRKDMQRKFKFLNLSNMPKIVCGEIANEEDFLAKLKEKHQYVIIRHKDGRARIIIDKSKGPVELEFVHPSLHDSDDYRWAQRVPQILDHRLDYDQVANLAEYAANTSDSQDKKLGQLIDYNLFHQKNIKSHIGAIQRMGEILERLEKKLGERK